MKHTMLDMLDSKALGNEKRMKAAKNSLNRNKFDQ